MATDSGFADQDEEASPLRPAWEDSPDETDAYLGRPGHSTGATAQGPGATAEIADLRGLLIPLCTASDALARLDASAAAADAALRDGLIARLAYAEAAGCLAHAHAWAHPLDLALREAGLTATTALAATGAGHRTLPQTFGGLTEPRDWADPPFDVLADGDRSVAEALALARALRRLTGRNGSVMAATATAVTNTLQTLGAGMPDPGHFSAWWDRIIPAPPARRHRVGNRGGEGIAPTLPPLLAAAEAAATWMTETVADRPTPAQAVFLAAAVLAYTGPIRTVFTPVWAACPALGFGDRAALPTLRSDAADRLLGLGQRVTWPLAFLHLTAESARTGLRELARLKTAAEKGRGLAQAADKRSRLPDAIDALLRTPVLTPKALAAKLDIAPQTATALLRDLQGRGVAREVTGRGSFRAFAI
jgi:hypothetical protein